jgi:hypothetical protein
MRTDVVFSVVFHGGVREASADMSEASASVRDSGIVAAFEWAAARRRFRASRRKRPDRTCGFFGQARAADAFSPASRLSSSNNSLAVPSHTWRVFNIAFSGCQMGELSRANSFASATLPA